MRETPVQQRIRLDAPRLNILLQRNNVGAAYDKEGRLIRYGLMNDTAALNHEIKSSDLIAIIPTVVTQDMVGRTVGLYGAIEVKASDWSFSIADARAVAQHKYHTLVQQYGGIGGFCRSVEEFRRLVGR